MFDTIHHIVNLSFQFEGKLTYGTVCQQCHYRSEIDMGFLELEINLEVRVIAYLVVAHLWLRRPMQSSRSELRHS